MPGSVVKGNSVCEKTYIDSVTSLFGDFFPQNGKSARASSRYNSSHHENFETILWAVFLENTQHTGSGRPTNELFSIVIGYSTGIQLWRLSEHGDATEYLSLRCGACNVFREVINPREKELDKYATKRPLAAYTSSQNGVKQAFKNLTYISLYSGERVHSISFTANILDIVSNDRVVVVIFHDRLAVFDSATLDHKFSVTSCYPSVSNCVSLSNTWLVYPDRCLVPKLQSSGGFTGDSRQSYTSTIVKSASYGLNVGLNLLTQYAGSTAAKSQPLNGGSSTSSGEGSEYASPFSSADSSPLGLNPHIPQPLSTRSGSVNGLPSDSGGNRNTSSCFPGILTVIDLCRVPKSSPKCKHVVVGTNETSGNRTSDEIIAHFAAHIGESVVAIELTSRSVVATAAESGRIFNVFKIHPHPWSSAQCSVHHLYALKRGETVAKINDLKISSDLRWVSGCSSKGTVHLFAINPYGGHPSPRTHCSDKVLNKEDKFYCSAGLDDVKPALMSVAAASNAAAALLSSSPSSPSFDSYKYLSIGSGSSGSLLGTRATSSFRAVLNGAVTHPRIPPFPHPLQLDPVAQIKAPSSSVQAACIPSGLNLNEVAVRSIFAPPCFNLDAFQLEFTSSRAGPEFKLGSMDASPTDRYDCKGPQGNESFYGFSLYSFFGTIPGLLLETSVRVSRDPMKRDQIEVTHSPTAQWKLTRTVTSKEVKPNGFVYSGTKEDKAKSPRGYHDVQSASNYESQQSYDSATTVTDLLNSSDLSSSKTAILHLDDSGKEGRALQEDNRSCELETKSGHYNYWMSQVEMSTHAPPHRRLWMGPQFTFKTIVTQPRNRDDSSPANLDITDTRTSRSNSLLNVNDSDTNVTESTLASVALASEQPCFQSIDKFDLDLLRMGGYVSPLVKYGRQGGVHRLLAASPTTPNSSCGASPPDGSQSSPSSGCNQVKSKPVPINANPHANNGSSNYRLHRGDRIKSDSGDSMSSGGSSGSLYPFYIEVGSGDFERQRNMLNVNPVHNYYNAVGPSTGQHPPALSLNRTAPNLSVGGTGMRSRPGSSASIDDMSSWGEDANLDDALNSLESDSNQAPDDFHDALDDAITDNGGKTVNAFNGLNAGNSNSEDVSVRRRLNAKKSNGSVGGGTVGRRTNWMFNFSATNSHALNNGMGQDDNDEDIEGLLADAMTEISSNSSSNSLRSPTAVSSTGVRRVQHPSSSEDSSSVDFVSSASPHRTHMDSGGSTNSGGAAITSVHNNNSSTYCSSPPSTNKPHSSSHRTTSAVTTPPTQQIPSDRP